MPSLTVALTNTLIFFDAHWRDAVLNSFGRTASAIRPLSGFRLICCCSKAKRNSSISQRTNTSTFQLRLKLWVRTWQYGLLQVIFGKRYRLWTPIPTLSTHMESTCLSPLFDWQHEFQDFEHPSNKSA